MTELDRPWLPPDSQTVEDAAVPGLDRVPTSRPPPQQLAAPGALVPKSGSSRWVLAVAAVGLTVAAVAGVVVVVRSRSHEDPPPSAAVVALRAAASRSLDQPSFRVSLSGDVNDPDVAGV